MAAGEATDAIECDLEAEIQMAVSQSNADPDLQLVGEAEHRDAWTSHTDFMLAAVGYAVGLGNVWRFPYLCYENGGAAFLFPYWFTLFVVGIPIFILELGTGQCFQKSGTEVWRIIHPRLSGLGWTPVILDFIVSLYYNVIIAWSFYYLFVSFQSPLPWKNQAETYFKETVLWESESINYIGTVDWPVFGCLTLAWILVCVCLLKGLASSGKVVYFTATFPFCVLLILLVRGLTLPGATLGLRFYLVPSWNMLLQPRVWVAAASQIFYSLGIGWGSLVAYGSYNKKTNNFVRDAWVISLINCGTSFFAGVAVFSALGFLAHTNGVPVESVVQSGTGLAFVAYPAMLAAMPGGPFFSVLFFLMLICLGIDSQFAMVETVISALMDSKIFPGVRKMTVTACLCFVSWLISIMFTTQAGFYFVHVFDTFTGTVTVFVVAVLEAVAITRLYGTESFCRDVERVSGVKLTRWVIFSWNYVVPVALLALTVAEGVALAMGSYADLGCEHKADEHCRGTAWVSYLGGTIAVGSLLVLMVMAIRNWRKPCPPRTMLTAQEREEFDHTATLEECENDKGDELDGFAGAAPASMSSEG